MEKMPKNLRPKGAIGVYILNDKNELLLLLRDSDHQRGKWCPPGGHIEYGESFFAAGKRETEEESGVKLEKIAVMGVTNDIYEEEKRHYINTHVKALKYSGQATMKEPHKFKDIGWFALDNLPKNLFPAVQRFLEQNPDCLCGSGKKYKECCTRPKLQRRRVMENKIKTLKFRRNLANEIITGKKTSTWRLFDDKDLKIGDKIDLLYWETKEKFAEAKITRVKEKKLIDIEEDDFEGHEKYSSKRAILQDLKKYYGNKVKMDTYVKIIKFKIISFPK